MNEIRNDLSVMEPPVVGADLRLKPVSQSVPDRPTFLARMPGRVMRLIPGLLALAAVAGVVLLGVKTGWKLPKFSALAGHSAPEKDDWCAEHSVPDSICVECKKDCMPRGPEYGWCRKHGVAECPFCHPDVAQLSSPDEASAEDLQRFTRAMQFPRIQNNVKCKMHQRLIQLSNDDVVAAIGVEVAPVGRAHVTEFVAVNGEVGFDQERVARLASRVPGVVWRVERQVGQWVNAGDLLALVDSADIGKAKAQYLEALAHADLKAKTLATLRASPQTVAERTVSEAESNLEEALIRLTNSEQALANLGLPLPPDEWKNLPAQDVAERVKFLGLPPEVTRSLVGQAASANLYPLRAPRSGLLVSRPPTAGEPVDTVEALFVVADTHYMWLTLEVRLEDARRIKIGQTVYFRPDGGDETGGSVSWLSTAVDEKTRTVKVRVQLPNHDGRMAAGTFGTGRVMMRDEARAIVVPKESVHWEGDCHVVFVRDKNFDRPDAKKVFHIRKVQPGVTANGNTEIIAGVLPGELVATKGSGIFRSELLRGNLGAG